jgi:hypothetical protein
MIAVMRRDIYTDCALAKGYRKAAQRQFVVI